MIETFQHLQLKALACALPERTCAVEDFIPRFGEETVARFKQVVGVERFPVAQTLRTSDLAEAAAKALIVAGKLDVEQVDVVLFVTQTPDAVAPATSALLQHRLGLSEQVFALDLNQGCAGFLAGLLTAAHFLSHEAVRNVLILGGDTLSRCVDPADHTSAMLFGDAGFAAVVGKDNAVSEATPWTFLSATATSTAIEIPHNKPFTMAGTEVFNFTITRVPEQLSALLAATGETIDAIDALYLHQANTFILRQVARMVRCPMEKVPCRMATRGNTSSASLPLLLCDLAAEGQTGIRRALLSAFGVGLTWISARMALDLEVCLPTLVISEGATP